MFGVKNSMQWNVLEPIVGKLGYRCLGIESFGKPPSITLRVFIDKEGGIAVTDCEKVSDTISFQADKVELGFDRLEVSSPGIDRKVFTVKDLKENIGNRVRVTLHRGVMDKKKHRGILQEVSDDKLTMLREDETEFVCEFVSIYSISLLGS